MSIPRVGNGTQACAACKYQRRKCASDCVLAPFFPHDRQRQFLNAHKLFGVSNITKIIRNLDPHQTEEAMRTIIIQSDVRASDPVGGCYKIILDLQRQIEYCKAELDLVLHQLAICQAEAQAQARAQAQAQQIQIPEPDSALTCDSLNVDPLGAYNPIQYQQLESQEEQFVFQENHNLQDVTSWVMQDPSASTLQIKQDFANEYDDIKPLFVISGERTDPKFDPEETIQQREEIILNGDNALLKAENVSIQQAQDHDLKGAATLFALTNCNAC